MNTLEAMQALGLDPDLTDAQGGTALEHDLIHVRRSQFLWNAAFRERIVAVVTCLGWQIESDR